jgi:hypothetical protein
VSVTPLRGVSASGQSPYTNDFANGVVQGTLSAVGPSKPFALYGPMNLWVWTEFTTALTVTGGSLNGSVVSAGGIAAGAAIRSTLLPPGTVAGSFSGTTPVFALPTQTFFGRTVNGQPQIKGIQDTTWLLGAAVTGLGFSGATVLSIDVPSVIGDTPVDGSTGQVTLSANASVGPQNRESTPFEFALASGGLVSGTDAAAAFISAAIGLTGQIQIERSFDGGQTWIVAGLGGGGALAQYSTATPLSLAFGEPERQTLYRLNLTALTPVAGNALKYRLSATGQQATSISLQTL